MFQLASVNDVVTIEPKNFSLGTVKALEDSINAKYANKVINNTGLCISLYDIIKAGDSSIGGKDGRSYTPVHFRMIVFRPFIDQVLVGTIRSNSEDGIRVSLGFFDDIYIPAANLFSSCTFNSQEQVWVWRNDDMELYLDNGDSIRFKVISEEFKTNFILDGAKKDVNESKVSPYTIIGSCNTEGMGCTRWWES